MHAVCRRGLGCGVRSGARWLGRGRGCASAVTHGQPRVTVLLSPTHAASRRHALSSSPASEPPHPHTSSCHSCSIDARDWRPGFAAARCVRAPASLACVTRGGVRPLGAAKRPLPPPRGIACSPMRMLSCRSSKTHNTAQGTNAATASAKRRRPPLAITHAPLGRSGQASSSDLTPATTSTKVRQPASIAVHARRPQACAHHVWLISLEPLVMTLITHAQVHHHTTTTIT